MAESIKSISNLILSMQEPGEQKRRASTRRTAPGIQAKLFEKSREGHHQSREKPMKSIRVKSNFARDRVVMLGTLVLHFDSAGFATMPEHQLSFLQEEMRCKPGRYQILPSVEISEEVPVVETVKEVKEQIQDLLSALKAQEDPELESAVMLKVEKSARPQRRQTRKKESKEE